MSLKKIIFDLEFTSSREIVQISYALNDGEGYSEIKTVNFKTKNGVDPLTLSIHGVVPRETDPLFSEWWKETGTALFAGRHYVAYGQEDLKILKKYDRNLNTIKDENYIDLYSQSVARLEGIDHVAKKIEADEWSYRQAHVYTYIYLMENDFSIENFRLPTAHQSSSDVEMAIYIDEFIEKKFGYLEENKCLFRYFPFGKFKGEKISEMWDRDINWVLGVWDIQPILRRSLERRLAVDEISRFV